MPFYSLGHHLLGIEGLALLRGSGQADEAARARRVAELLEIATGLDRRPYSDPREVPPIGVTAGYAAWAESYDEPGNVTIAMEETVVHELLGELPPGSEVLDAARAGPAATRSFSWRAATRWSASIAVPRCWSAPPQACGFAAASSRHSARIRRRRRPRPG